MIPVQNPLENLGTQCSHKQNCKPPSYRLSTPLVQTIYAELRWGPKPVPMLGRNKKLHKLCIYSFPPAGFNDSLPLLSTYWWHKSTFLLWIWAPLRAMFIHSLPIKNRNGLAEDVKDSSTTDTVQAPLMSQAQTVTHKMRHSWPSCVFMNFKLW